MTNTIEHLKDDVLAEASGGFFGILAGLVIYLIIESVNNPDDVKAGLRDGYNS